MNPRLSALLASIAVLAWAAAACGQETNKKVDPSGSWRWEREMRGEKIKTVLKLNLNKDGQVVGVYQGRREPVEIKEGKMEGDQLSFHLDLEFQGQALKIEFAGKIQGDDLEGNISARADAGEREFPWKAKRSVEMSDLLGTWQFRIESPDGNLLEPTLAIHQKDESAEDAKVEAVYTSTQGAELEVKDLRVKENHVLFTIVADLGGQELKVDYKGRPFGDRISGMIDYQIGGQSGQVDFTGKRKREAKEKEDKEEAAAEASN